MGYWHAKTRKESSPAIKDSSISSTRRVKGNPFNALSHHKGKAKQSGTTASKREEESHKGNGGFQTERMEEKRIYQNATKRKTTQEATLQPHKEGPHVEEKGRGEISLVH